MNRIYRLLSLDFLIFLLFCTNQIIKTAITITAIISKYMEYLSIFFQLLPSFIPTYVSIEFHITDPTKVYITNLVNLVFPIPAGSETYVLITGNSLPTKETLSPYLLNKFSVISRCLFLKNMYLP